MTEYPEGSTAEENLNKTIENINTDTTNLGETNYTTYTISKNGTYTFEATIGEKTTQTKIRVKKIEKFKKVEDLKLSYANSEQKAYKYNGASIPKGYYVDTRTKVDTGLVITDDIDEEGYSTGNEWVWVPVNSVVGNDEYFIKESGTLAGDINITYSNYSKLWSFVTDGKTRTHLSNPQITPSSEVGNREPSLVIHSTYGEKKYFSTINKRGTEDYFNDVDGVATQYVTDYNKMVKSVNEYGGFFIGRYELIQVDGISKVQHGDVLKGKTWYYFYNQCMTLGKNNTNSGMIYGTLFDATMQWLVRNGYTVGKATVNYDGYGNYYSKQVDVKDDNTIIIVKPQRISKELKTGEMSYTKSNNIYDLSGNCWDWTQEVRSNVYRVARGGIFDDVNGYYNYSAVRDNYGYVPWVSYQNMSTRACIYIVD